MSGCLDIFHNRIKEGKERNANFIDTKLNTWPMLFALPSVLLLPTAMPFAIALVQLFLMLLGIAYATANGR